MTEFSYTPSDHVAIERRARALRAAMLKEAMVRLLSRRRTPGVDGQTA